MEIKINAIFFSVTGFDCPMFFHCKIFPFKSHRAKDSVRSAHAQPRKFWFWNLVSIILANTFSVICKAWSFGLTVFQKIPVLQDKKGKRTSTRAE